MSNADAGVTVLCSGFNNCRSHGYSTHGYASAWGNMYWRMYSGRNCTNYAAYRMVEAGLPNARPWSGNGNATHWGYEMGSITDHTPHVGAVAWWSAASAGAGSMGHVAVVEHVISSHEIVISESNYGSDFSYRRITRSSSYWPSGFIHFADRSIRVTEAPRISGTAAVGKPLTVKPGHWTPTPTGARFQWTADGKAIHGATGRTYHPSASVVGKRIAVRVTGTRRGFGSTTRTTPSTAPVGGGTIALYRQPRISGALTVGSTVSVAGAGYSEHVDIAQVRWFAGTKLVAAGSSRYLRLTPAMAGKRLGAIVVPHRAGYSAKSSWARTSGVVARATARLVRQPHISGALKVGSTVSVGGAGYSRHVDIGQVRWFAGTKLVAAGSSRYLRLTPAMAGKRLGVVVVPDRAGYIAKSGQARTVGVVARDTAWLGRQPHISGSLTVGSTVSVGGAGYSRHVDIGQVRWFAGTKLVAAGSSRYLKLTPAMAGKRIGVVVVPNRAGYDAQSSWARTSGTVSGRLVQTSVGQVKGTTKLGGGMQVTTPGTFNYPVRVAYQWIRDGRYISGATSARYTLTSADLGHRISVTVWAAAPGHGYVRKTYGPSSAVHR